MIGLLMTNWLILQGVGHSEYNGISFVEVPYIRYKETILLNRYNLAVFAGFYWTSSALKIHVSYRIVWSFIDGINCTRNDFTSVSFHCTIRNTPGQIQLTITVLAYFSLIYPLTCTPAGTAEAYFRGNLNNHWRWNHALTCRKYCMWLVNVTVSSEYTYIDKSCFTSFWACGRLQHGKM